jgi:hypothetical protein
LQKRRILGLHQENLQDSDLTPSLIQNTPGTITGLGHVTAPIGNYQPLMVYKALDLKSTIVLNQETIYSGSFRQNQLLRVFQGMKYGKKSA